MTESYHLKKPEEKFKFIAANLGLRVFISVKIKNE